MTLKVLTFNIFHDYPALRHFEERLAILERALVAEAADLVVLQEAWISRTHGDLVARLVEGLRQCGLAYQQFYAPANGSVGDGGEFEEGSAILSRWPIADAEARELAPEHPIERTWQGYVYQERRIAVRASVMIPGRCRLQVFGTHLTDFAPADGSSSARERQIRSLVDFVEAHGDDPALVAGDFNATPDAAEMSLLGVRGIVDLCAEHEPGPTNDAGDRELESPGDTSGRRIDYLFVRSGRAWTAVSRARPRLFLAEPVRTAAGGWLWASDHNGIVAELEVAPRR